MTRILVVALVAALAFAVVPAAFATEVPASTIEAATEAPTEAATEVAEEPTETAPLACANPNDLEVVTPAGLDSTIPTPVFDGPGTEYKEYLVDLSAASLDATAPVNITLTWGLRVNDYDLGAISRRSEGFTDNFQPIDPAEEATSVVAGHCEVIEVQAINFLAPIDIDTLALDFAVGTVTHPVTP